MTAIFLQTKTPSVVSMYVDQDPMSNRMFITTFAVCGLVAAVLVSAVAIFLVRKHAKSKEKLVRLSQDDPSYEACKDYQVRSECFFNISFKMVRFRFSRPKTIWISCFKWQNKSGSVSSSNGWIEKQRENGASPWSFSQGCQQGFGKWLFIIKVQHFLLVRYLWLWPSKTALHTCRRSYVALLFSRNTFLQLFLPLGRTVHVDILFCQLFTGDII